MERSALLEMFDCSLANVREKFAQVQKHASISVWEDIESDLTTVLSTLDTKVASEYKKKVNFLLANVNLEMGIMLIDSEESKAGEERLKKCMDLIDGKELEPEAVLIALAALNQLGIVWSQWDQPMKAKHFLEHGERIYKDYTDSSIAIKQEPGSILSYFGIDNNSDHCNLNDNLEELHTKTLYYLLQIYELIKDDSKSAIYCHKTLYRLLGDANNIKDLDYVDWALNVATLSQYFVEKKLFSQARYYLAAAVYVMQKYERLLRKRDGGNDANAEALAADWENYKHRNADVARCWGEYGISLMFASKQRLLQKTEDDDITESTASDENSKQPLDEQTTNHLRVLKFRIPEDDIEPLVSQVTNNFLLDFNDAKKVFLNVKKWLDEAKCYYTLENHASDYVEIIQEMSRAFMNLTFFEDNEDRQAQIHKRRIDILESVMKELNPRYYKHVCRQISFELGDIYSNILDIKRERLRGSTNEMSNVSTHVLTKINRLANNAIQHFRSYLSFVDHSGTKIADDLLRPTLYAYFRIGTLYNRIMTYDKRTKLVNTEHSVNAFKFVVNYCEKDPKAADIMKTELALSTQLVSVLAISAIRLRLQITDQ